MRKLAVCFILILLSSAALAKAKRNSRATVGRQPAQEADAYRFAPPPPPMLEPPEYDELEDEEFDDGFRPPPVPPIPSANPSQQPNNNQNPTAPGQPPADFRNSGSYLSGPGKFRFQVVEGEFYNKGKKRGRGKKVIGQSGGN